MNIIVSIIIGVLLAFIGYLIYKNKDTCKFDPGCYFKKIPDTYDNLISGKF